MTMNYVEIYFKAPHTVSSKGRETARINAEYELSRMGGEYEYGFAERSGAVVTAPAPAKAVKSCRVSESEIYNCCANTLIGIGLTAKHDGFSYICDCVFFVLSSKYPLPLKNIYLNAAKIYGVSAASVERSVRYAIKRIANLGDIAGLSRVFGDADICPENFTSSRFIGILASDVYKKLVPFAAHTI